MACSRRVRIAGEGRLELRIPERVAEGHHRLPDRLVHEHATAGDAPCCLELVGLEGGGRINVIQDRPTANLTEDYEADVAL
jgi:hypothetical protein